MITCEVCGREDLKLPAQVHKDKDFKWLGAVGFICPRCRGIYCSDCLGELPRHEDGRGRKCQLCGKYFISEIYKGQPDWELDDCARYSKETYG